MSSTTVQRAAAARRLRPWLILAGLSQLLVGAWQAVSPGTFFREVAAFGVRNDHFIRDIATLYLALGIVLVIAAFRPSWRVPVLAFATLEYALHTVNHLIDVGKTSPGWIGPVDLAAVSGGAILFALLLRASWKEARS